MAKRPPSFLVTLLRRGAPALATATSELSDEVGDPTPMRALRRIQHMAGPVDTGYRDNLLLRAARYVALVPLVYRLLAVPGAFGVYVSTHGMTGIAPVGLVTLGSVALSGYGIRWMLRSAPFQPNHAARLLAIDLVFTLLALLIVGAFVPASVFTEAMVVPGKHLLGEVALLALALGIAAAAALAIVSFPIRMLASLFGTGQAAPGEALATFPSILGVLFTATGALVLIGLGTRLALAYGIRNGRIAERARQHRMLHDSVLQTLEAISLADRGDPVERLAEVQRLARAQSMELRRTIESEASGRSEAGSRPLGEKLASLAAEMARDGLRAQLVIAELDDDTLSEVRQVAIRDAVRESLRNTLKHAGTDQVVVRVEEQEGGIAVITRDHGAGFSLDSRPAGFGISESITARLNEVGGTARVESAPGNGTRVTLWVPF